MIPTLMYAMEVWTPTNKEEESAVHDLTKIIDRALALAVLGFKGNNWQTRRCLKMPVIRVLLGIPSATTLLETAHMHVCDMHVSQTNLTQNKKKATRLHPSRWQWRNRLPHNTHGARW